MARQQDHKPPGAAWSLAQWASEKSLIRALSFDEAPLNADDDFNRRTPTRLTHIPPEAREEERSSYRGKHDKYLQGVSEFRVWEQCGVRSHTAALATNTREFRSDSMDLRLHSLSFFRHLVGQTAILECSPTGVIHSQARSYPQRYPQDEVCELTDHTELLSARRSPRLTAAGVYSS